MPSPLIDSLLQAVSARPDDVPLRLHVTELLIEAGRGPEAIQQCAIVLQQDPGNSHAQGLMGRAFAAPVASPDAPASSTPAAAAAPVEPAPAGDDAVLIDPVLDGVPVERPEPQPRR
ncbi:MAG: tetratricopeptide repeat protein, partial [Propionibacteriaceae bacterium]|nr:tetratricopeptide repeat protein [Propionibacteriaceae bacterium]